MRKIWLFLLFIGCFYTSTAQYTELINSRRPGFSDSPFSVGTNVLQFEGGLFYEKIKNQDYKINSYGTDIMVRYGKFFEKLEVNLNLAFQYDKVNYKDAVLADISSTNLNQLTIGAKYLVYMPKYLDKSKEIRSWKKKTRFDWKRLIPSVAVYAGANIPITESFIGGNSPGYIKGSFSPRIAIYTQNDFTDRFIFLMNLIMDKIGSGQRENSYILTGTYTLDKKLSVFAEHQGIFKDNNIPNDYQFGGGVAYLLTRNMQADVSVRSISDRDGSTFLVGAGLAWRLDRHRDQFKTVDSDGKETKEKKEGNLFSRLFGKNKDKKQRKVKKVKAKKRKIKELKPQKSKKQKRTEKEAKKKAKKDKKSSKKNSKKKKKDYDKNYEPPKDNSVNDNN